MPKTLNEINNELTDEVLDNDLLEDLLKELGWEFKREHTGFRGKCFHADSEKLILRYIQIVKR